jgi:hypothetical protein
MKKETKILLLISLLIIFFGFMAYYRLRQFQRSFQKLSLPKIENPQPETLFLSEDQEGEKEFITPDGKLKIKYPANWLKGEKESFPMLKEDEEAKSLFFAYKVNWRHPTPSYLIIQETPLKEIDEIVEKMKKETEEKGGQIKIIKLEKGEKGALWEAEYQKKTGEIAYALHSKGRIIFGQGKNYLVTIFAFEENWSEVSAEVEKILDSIELLAE